MLLKKSKMHISIGAMLREMWMLGEIVCFAVLQDEEGTLFEQLFFKDIVWQQGQLRQHIGGIGKDKIKAQCTGIQILEHIAPHYGQVVYSQLFARGNNKVLLSMRHLDGSYGTRATTDKLQSDASGTCKQIQHIAVFKVDAIV